MTNSNNFTGLLKIQYKNAYDFAQLLTEEQRNGLSLEEYAVKETIEWEKNMKKLKKQTRGFRY